MVFPTIKELAGSTLRQDDRTFYFEHRLPKLSFRRSVRVHDQLWLHERPRFSQIVRQYMRNRHGEPRPRLSVLSSGHASLEWAFKDCGKEGWDER